MSIPEAIKGAQAELARIQKPIDRARRVLSYAKIISAELFGTVLAVPYGLRAFVLHRSLPDAAIGRQRNQSSVSILRDVRYSNRARNVMDIYLPPNTCLHELPAFDANSTAHASHQAFNYLSKGSVALQQDSAPEDARYEAQQAERALEGLQQGGAGAPMVLFCHGGVWATGAKWHYSPMATRLAQAGVVTAVMQYTLYPEVLVPHMVAEVSRALSWTFDHGSRLGGNPSRLTLVGHSSGAHTCTMALLHRALETAQPGAGEGVAARTGGGGAAVKAASTGGQGASGGGGVLGAQQDNQMGQLGRQGRERSKFGSDRGEGSVQGASKAAEVASSAMPGVDGISGNAGSTAGAVLRGGLEPAAAGSGSCGGGPEGGRDAFADPRMPALFVGMAGVYDLAKHYQYEERRGLHTLSTMARACGGVDAFPSLSPSLILGLALGQEQQPWQANQGNPGKLVDKVGQPAQQGQQADDPSADTAANRIFGATCPPSASHQGLRESFTLAGESIARRMGFNRTRVRTGASPSAPGSTARSAGGSDFGGDSQGALVSISRSALGAEAQHAAQHSQHHGAGGGGERDSILSLSPAAARRLPPTVLMSSFTDVVVPWYESSEVYWMLHDCGVPAKHLVYEKGAHEDFVMGWRPLPVIGERPAEEVGDLPAIAADLVRLAIRRPGVHFD